MKGQLFFVDQKIVARPHRGRARHVCRGIDSHERAVIFCRAKS